MNFSKSRQRNRKLMNPINKIQTKMNLSKASKILAGCMVLTMMSCWKNTETFQPYEIIEQFEIEDLFTELRNEAIQTFTAHTGQEIYILTPKKNIILIDPNTLVNPDGSSCDCPVTVEYIEASTKGEILLYGQHTITPKELLESAGEIYIKIKSDAGKELKLAPGEKVKLQIQKQGSGSLDSKMEMFYGSGEGAQFAWTQTDGNPDTWNTANGEEWSLRDSLQGWGFGYECFPEELTWINIDKFVDVPDDEKTEVCVKLPDGYTNTNTAVFMVFNDMNSVVALEGDPETELWCEPYGKVPVGFEVTFVAISKQGEEVYHLGSSMTKIEFDHLEEFELEEKSLEYIKEFIMNL